jgi:hypothetical protein
VRKSAILAHNSFCHGFQKPSFAGENLTPARIKPRTSVNRDKKSEFLSFESSAAYPGFCHGLKKVLGSFTLAARHGSNRELLKRIGRFQREARSENRRYDKIWRRRAGTATGFQAIDSLHSLQPPWIRTSGANQTLDAALGQGRTAGKPEICPLTLKHMLFPKRKPA